MFQYGSLSTVGFFPPGKMCEAKMAEREAGFALADHKFAYTMRCEKRDED